MSTQKTKKQNPIDNKINESYKQLLEILNRFCALEEIRMKIISYKYSYNLIGLRSIDENEMLKEDVCMSSYIKTTYNDGNHLLYKKIGRAHV